MGSNTRKEIVVRLCERISGSIGGSALPDESNRPVKAALPSVAAIPHMNVAAAMYAYPRIGCGLFVKDFVEPFRIEPDHDFIPDYERRGRMAVVFLG
jgi:hypothetical protein